MRVLARVREITLHACRDQPDVVDRADVLIGRLDSLTPLYLVYVSATSAAPLARSFQQNFRLSGIISI